MASTVWKGHLTFGLISLPVKLHSAARSATVSFNQLHKTDHSRIKQVLHCAAEDKAIPRAEIVKGYEYEKDRYVLVTDDEIEKVAPKTARSVEVLEFVKATEVSPVFLDSSYYLAPDAVAGEKPYALLYETLKQTGMVGVAKIAMHNREHIVILRPGDHGIVVHTMFYPDEVRQVEEFRTDTSALSAKELELAKTLVLSLEAKFEPQKYNDDFRHNLLSMIQAKVEGKEIVGAPEPAHRAPVIDILEALKKSIAQGKTSLPQAAAALGEHAAAQVQSGVREATTGGPIQSPKNPTSSPTARENATRGRRRGGASSAAPARVSGASGTLFRRDAGGGQAPPKAKH